MSDLRNPQAAWPFPSKRTPIPEGVVFDAEHASFYRQSDMSGMGVAFWETWRHRAAEFPQVRGKDE